MCFFNNGVFFFVFYFFMRILYFGVIVGVFYNICLNLFMGVFFCVIYFFMVIWNVFKGVFILNLCIYCIVLFCGYIFL